MDKYINFYNFLDYDQLKVLLPFKVIVPLTLYYHDDYFRWCTENCVGKWSDVPTVYAYTSQKNTKWSFLFERKDDALLFKLAMF